MQVEDDLDAIVRAMGEAGRMGQRLIALAKQAGEFEIVGAIERPDHPAQARDAGEGSGVGPIGVPITYDLKPTPDVLIDFTSPASMRHWLKTCRDRGIAMVIGTTGLQALDHAAIDQAAADIPDPSGAEHEPGREPAFQDRRRGREAAGR